MKIYVERLSATPAPFHFEASPAWLADLRARGVEEGPVEAIQFRGRVHRMGSDIYLEGAAAGHFEYGCSRCLARYRHPLEEPFRLVLEPAGERVPPDPEGAEALARDGLWLSDEIETGWFRGSEVQLGAFLLEVVALALPVKPVCREDCRGLCPQCGVDRNVSACSCEEVRPESPFAVLRALRGGGGEG